MKKAANDTLKNDALLKEIEQDVKNEKPVGQIRVVHHYRRRFDSDGGSQF